MPTHKNIKLNPVKLSIITVSSSRYAQKQKGNSVVDDSGQIAIDSLLKDGHEVISSKIVADDSTLIKSESLKSIIEDRVDGLILIGGTGLSKNDVTVETISILFDKQLDGFSELFRLKSYEQIGTASYLSQVSAGSIGDTLVFCIPGSPKAVMLAMELILPELSHAVGILKS